ncbi:hypothetical protein [Methylobacterium sp. E-066]|uniref:hypothetical protein n=1 Tax=Methylobacterium sp. E-066 TaxID=2836584 RepID=UPI001FBAC507|nr:hypothetical protein [Methylobacterium sp. E-066]MCJ2144727.1 hypothetical protein [Methylobacterium sp. E-066]
MSELHRPVYARKNLLEMNEAEASAAIAQTLETSRRNNAKVEVAESGCLRPCDGTR